MRTTLRDVDVFCFQEAFLPASIALCEGFEHHALGLSGAYNENPTGLVTVARHPINIVSRIAFRGERRNDDKTRPAPQKGALFVTMKTPFGEVDVINVHFSTGEEERKRAEVRHLRDMLDEHATRNPLILAGDFNFSDRSALFGELEQSIGVTFASRGVGSTHGGPRKGIVAWPEPPMQVDHVFCRSSPKLELSVEKARVIYDAPLHDRFGREVHASDHNGVLVDLQAVVVPDATWPTADRRKS